LSWNIKMKIPHPKVSLLVIFVLLVIPLVNAQVSIFGECNRPTGTAPLLRHLNLPNYGALVRVFENCALANRGSSLEEIIDAVSLDEFAIYGCRVPEGIVNEKQLEAIKQAFKICLLKTIQGRILFGFDDNDELIVLDIDAQVRNVSLSKLSIEQIGIKIPENATIIIQENPPSVRITNTNRFIFYDAYSNSNNIAVILPNITNRVSLHGEGKICGDNFIINDVSCTSSASQQDGCISLYSNKIYMIYPNTIVRNYPTVIGPIALGPFEEQFVIGDNLLPSEKTGNFVNFIERNGIPTLQIGNKGATGVAEVKIGDINLICSGPVVAVVKGEKILRKQEIYLGKKDFLMERYYFTEKKPVLTRSYVIHPEEGYSVLYKREKNYSVTVPKDASVLNRILSSYYPRK